MGTTYEIHEIQGDYDNNECDARGYPTERWHSSGTPYDSHHEPRVGDSWLFEENGKLYQRTVRRVISNGHVWEDVESLDVEYSTSEIKPDEFVVDKKMTEGGKETFGIVNGRLEITVPYEYDELECQNYPLKHLAKVKKSGKWGVLDCRDGKVMIPELYDEIVCFETSKYYHHFWMCCKDGQWTLLDETFSPTVPSQKDFYGFQKMDGYTVLGGRSERYVGMVDRDMRIVIPFIYDSISADDNGVLHVMKGDSFFLFNLLGEQLAGPYRSISDPLKRNYRTSGPDGGKGLIMLMKDGSIKEIPAIFSSFPYFSNGICESQRKVSFEEGSGWNREKRTVYVTVRYDPDGHYELPDGTVMVYPSQFAHEDFLRTIVIPETVQTIGEKAFEYCTNLEQIILPPSIHEIKDQTFSGCKSLQCIVISNGVGVIGKMAFSGCRSLQYVLIPEGVKTIKKNAFSGCESLTSIILPERLERLEEGVFSHCSQLKDIYIPKAVKYIDQYAFSCCVSLEAMTIDVVRIGFMSFSACYQLKQLSFSCNVRTIDRQAFVNCRSLESVIIPDTVEYLGSEVFKGCTCLKSVSLKKELYNEKWNQFPESTEIHFL